MGILGAAKIAKGAIVDPARDLAEVTVVAVASRDQERARMFAAKHGIPTVYANYEALLSAQDVDAVYIPLPNSLHCEWTIRALQAGKHVLCEKPIAANAEQAERMMAAAAENDRLLAEGFHYRYHPMAERLKQIIESADLGELIHVEAMCCLWIPRRRDIRFRYDLAGGATMDTGCYAIDLLRYLVGADPEVIHAEARLAAPQVDRWMTASLRFPSGVTGRLTCSLVGLPWRWRLKAMAKGSQGEMIALNPYLPQLFNKIYIQSGGSRRTEVAPRGMSTYTRQLSAFVKSVKEGAPMATSAVEALGNMRVIDQVYEKAGLKRRGA
jgi:predicted dehydrogenase